MSDEDYNVESGEGYLEGTSKVEMKVANVNKDQVHYWINEIANQYADFVITNVNTGSDKISFDIGSPSMEDLTAQDIKFRIEEYLTMNIPPFELKELKVS
jgi:DNA phosphorothioation-dependent restriction protein DptG